jgi:hypothetical protein
MQVLWLCKAKIEFDQDDSPGSHRVKPHASFVAFSDLMAEFDYRVIRTGRDGETLKHEVRELNVYQFQQLSQAARDAVNYIVGVKRKRMEYQKWLNQRQRRNVVV